MLYFFLSRDNVQNNKMTFLCWYFGILLVHSYSFTVTTALPASKTLKSPYFGTNSKQLKAPADFFPLKIENEKFRPSAPPFKSIQHEKHEEKEEKKKELQFCKVSNKTYQHREQIPRSDPCEICVCVDSEMFCFWKLCTYYNNLTTFTQAPATAYKSKQETIKQSTDDNNVTLGRIINAETKTNELETRDEKFSKILKNQRKYNALKKLEATSPENMKSQNSLASTEKPAICNVMGVTYKYGEVLPRDTGTCLECACSEGGRVSCTPKDCVSQPDLDYLSHNNNLDMFDLDTF